MSVRVLDRLVAASLFVFALILYLATVSPSASFWDAGERIAAAHGLQIPHPPGAPFYMLIARAFSMFAPAQYVALSVNLVSVVASALTILLTFLIIVRLVREWRGPRDAWGPVDRLVALGGGALGALTLAVSDSFWFNALEAETYATSTFFTALCVWLTLRWLEQARRQDALLAAGRHHTFGSGAERWLLVIAYLYGLAIGVHLLSLLSIFFVALIVFFQHFEREDWTPVQVLRGLVVAAAVSTGVFLLVYPGMIQILPEFARQSGAPVLFLLFVVAAVGLGVWYTARRQWHVANLLLLGMAVVMVGYSSYGVILLRSQANPPIDQNDPENVDAFISYMKREQYGATPLLRGPAFDDRTGRVSQREERLFPRRWSAVPEHEAVYAQYPSDWSFFWGYQIGHMYVRYFLWQWVGRSADTQDATWTAGIGRRASLEDAARPLTPSERAGRNAYFGLPLLLGLFGLGFHVTRDWRRALAVGVLFLATGIAIVLYLNQTPLQPRERDYSYAGSFFAFSLWIGIGAAGLIELATGALRERAARAQLMAGGAVAGLLLLAVPGMMFAQNLDSHDRSGRYVAPDFAYNMLTSLAPNAILFTNGDNDTFPLWYLQEVEGVRRDVRVANLSLLQTDWYIRQLRNQWSRDSAPIPMTFPDEAIGRLRPTQWEPSTFDLPVRDVSAETRAQWGNPADLPQAMSWDVEGRDFGPNFRVLLVNDQVILSILAANAERGWERPIYFATTTALDGQVGLAPFLQQDGLALRVTPIRNTGPGDRVVPEMVRERLADFRFRNLDNPNVYFDQNKRQMIDSYRSAVFGPVARQLARMGRTQEAREVLARVQTAVPFETVPPSFVSLYMLAEAHHALGDRDQVVALMARAEPEALARLEAAQTSRAMDLAAQYVQTVQSFYLEVGAFEQASAFSDRIALALGDPRYRQSPEELREMFEAAPRRPQPTPQTDAPPDVTLPEGVPLDAAQPPTPAVPDGG
jgi:hypothetical protein